MLAYILARSEEICLNESRWWWKETISTRYAGSLRRCYMSPFKIERQAGPDPHLSLLVASYRQDRQRSLNLAIEAAHCRFFHATRPCGGATAMEPKTSPPCMGSRQLELNLRQWGLRAWTISSAIRLDRKPPCNQLQPCDA